MKVYIDRAHCEACQSFCDRHVAKLVRFPEGEDRPCIQKVEEDGLIDLTLVVRDHDGHQITLVLDEKERAIVAIEGLSSYLNAPDSSTPA
jgi:hypothetical protein